MKCFVLLLSSVALLRAYFGSFAIADISDQIIEYQIEENQYAVVVVQEEGLSAAEAKSIARQRAAVITVAKGYRYYTVQSEQKTEVMKSDRPFPDNQAFYQNMYQELIIEGDFDKQRLERRSIPSENIYPGIRLIFKCYKDKPWGKSVDACTLTDCS